MKIKKEQNECGMEELIQSWLINLILNNSMNGYDGQINSFANSVSR
jgi:hypothetical protein